MNNITFDYKSALKFFSEEEIVNVKEQVKAAHVALHSKTGAGDDFLGWVNLPEDYDKEEFARIKAAAQRIRENSDVLIVIGIGGSYLGAKAAIDFLTGPFYNYTSKTQIFFAGNSISSTYLADLLEAIEGRLFFFKSSLEMVIIFLLLSYCTGLGAECQPLGKTKEKRPNDISSLGLNHKKGIKITTK